MRAGTGRRRSAALLAGITAAWLCAQAPAETVRVDSLLSLVKEGKRYDGAEISLEGEAVGEVMRRGSYAWVNLLSPEDVALGIVVTPEQARRISRTGDYFHAGDRIRVMGTFHRFAARYGGETCVVARELTVVKGGRATPHPVARRRVSAAISLTALAVLSLIALAVKCRRNGPLPPVPPRQMPFLSGYSSP